MIHLWANIHGISFRVSNSRLWQDVVTSRIEKVGLMVAALKVLWSLKPLGAASTLRDAPHPTTIYTEYVAKPHKTACNTTPAVKVFYQPNHAFTINYNN
jgi:hypothetical protein